MLCDNRSWSLLWQRTETNRESYLNRSLRVADQGNTVRWHRAALAMLSAVSLAACGGGSGSSNIVKGGTAPTITAQPQNQTVALGATATFSVAATGTAPLSYQWSESGTAINGATSSSYTTPATVSGDNGATFTVAVSNSAGSQTSNAATLTVTGAAVAPMITSQPQSQSVTVGATATFSVTATGTAPLSYQWSKSGAAITGATGATYTTPATVSGDNGATFTVKVSNAAGSQTSNAVTLTVTAGAVGPTITSQPASQTVTVGATATFSVAATGTAPLTYQWSKSGAAIAGATGATYTTPATVSGDNGATFTVKVSNVAGSQTSSAATLTVNVPPAITTQPASISVALGLTATFSVVATGTAPLSYQWYKNGTAISGGVGAIYTTPATVSGDNGASFTVKVSNVAGTQTSSAAILTVTGITTAPNITTQPQSQTVTVGATATFSVVATGTAPLSYQWSKNGTVVSGATAATYTTPATVSGDNGASFTVKVSNVAGSQTSNPATLTVNAAGAATPIMFQHIASSTDPTGNGISGHTFVFSTETLPANTVAVMGVSAPASITVTVSDTLVGSWSAALCTASGGSGNEKASVFVQTLGTGGADTITIDVGSSSTQPVQFDITFWENIDTSTPANGSLCTGNITPASGGVINPGSFTPTTDNDANGGNVIWNYTPICSLLASSNPSSWSASSGFTLLNGDIIWATDDGFPEASQYYVQTTSASVTPAITATGDTADCFNSVSVALPVANNATTAPSAIHVAKIVHESYITFSSPGTQKVLFPTMGNLRVATFSWADGCPGAGAGCVSGLSSSDGCSWTLQIPNSGAGIAYAQNCAPCPTCTVNLIYSGGQTLPQASFRLYDVQNARASSFQNIVGAQGGCNTSVTDAPTITPSGASSGLMIAVLGNGDGPVTQVNSPSGAVFDLWTFAGQTDNDLADNADASSHLYYSSTATQNWNYTKTNAPDQCYWAAAAFN
jgi:hypothetical protein